MTVCIKKSYYSCSKIKFCKKKKKCSNKAVLLLHGLV